MKEFKPVVLSISKHFLRLRDLGRPGLERFLRVAPVGTEPGDPGGCARSANPVLLFAERSPEEELFLKASAREAGGGERYFGPGLWRGDPVAFVENVFFERGECRVCAVYGLARRVLESLRLPPGVALLNAGGPDGHPCRALADLTLMHEKSLDPGKLRVAWVGGADGLAHSLIEAAMLLPFELFMAVPEWGEPDRGLLGLAFAAGAGIFLTRDARAAVDGAHYVYAGAGPEQVGDSATRGRGIAAGMLIDRTLMEKALPGAALLLGREGGCRVERELLDEHAPTARRRFAARLRAQRLIWDLLSGEAQA
jgi:ornithine carbamoyltransferase